jgi:hypothetical protein
MEIEPTIPPSVIFSDGVIREDRTGKLSLIGTFHHFNPPGFVFQPPPFFITVSLANFRGSLDRFKITIRIEDKSSGHVIFSAAGEISSSNVLDPSDTVQIPFQVKTAFPHAGLYAVVVLVESEPIGSCDLVIKEARSRP